MLRRNLLVYFLCLVFYETFMIFVEGLTQYITVMSCIAIDGKPIFGAIYRPFFNETCEI